MQTGTDARVLIMTAVEAERQAVLRGLRGDGRFDVRLAGVGPAMAAARTAAALAGAASGAGWRLVVSAGIGGGFPGRAPVGSVVVSDGIAAADLGAETPDGFLGVDELGFGTARLPVDAALARRAAQALEKAGLTVAVGPVLTVSAATGTAETAAARAARFPGAAAEGMEGYGVAVAAAEFGLPALELRAVSNAVGPRDRAAWRIPQALTALERACATLPEVLFTP